MMNQKSTGTIFVVLLIGLASSVVAQRPKTNTRIFWIDGETQKLSWGDIVTTDSWSLKTGTVDGFPKTDSEASRLGPLFDRNGLVISGATRLDNSSKKGSWFAINAGVTQEPHGNHFHWKYTGRPTVTQKIEQDGQRSALQVSFHGDRLYLVGEGGFTSTNLNSLKIRGTTTGAGQFVSVTDSPLSQLAIVDNVVGYSAWENDDGEHAGQIDVVKLGEAGKPAYSFKLPSGNIRSAAVNNGKIFFAHRDAVSWIAADRSLSLNGDNVKVNTVSPPANQQLELTNPPEALVNERNWVIFTVGTGESSRLCMVDAAAQNPTMIALPIEAGEGLRLSPPSTVLSMGKRYAFVFQERIQPTSDVKEQLTIVELDPNRDMRFDDARIVKTLPVGSTAIKDSTGYHRICFDDYGRFAVFTNPGDGTLSVMSMHDLKLRVSFKVGGVPTEITAVGAPEHFH